MRVNQSQIDSQYQLTVDVLSSMDIVVLDAFTDIFTIKKENYENGIPLYLVYFSFHAILYHHTV